MTTTINAVPKQGLTKLSTGERLRSKIVTLDLTNTEGEKAGLTDLDGVKDLARDLYHQLHKADPKYVDSPPLTRAVNQQILDFAKSSTYWDKTKNSTTGNLLTAMHSAVLLHSTLLADDKMKEALRQQEQGQKQQSAADQQQGIADMLNSVADQMKDGDSKDEMRQQAQDAQTAANKAQEKADKAMGQAQQIVGKQLGDGKTKAAARIISALKKAAEESQDLADSISGWGSGPGSEIKQDASAAMDYLKRINADAKLAQIAKLAGRFKGIALSARTSRVAVGNAPYDATYTQEIQKVFASELALLSPNVPPFLRAKKAAQFADQGLLGLDTRGEAKESGPFVWYSDTSGSMWGERDVIAKAVGLGIAQVAKNEDRRYVLGIFSDESHDGFAISDKSSWQDHLDWGGRMINGGTSFDKALKMLMSQMLMMKAKHGDAIGDADAVIASDGEALVSKEVADKWKEFAEEHGTRLLFLCVHQRPYEGDGVRYFGLHALADKTIQVNDLDRTTGDQLAEQIGTWIQ